MSIKEYSILPSPLIRKRSIPTLVPEDYPQLK